MCDDSHDLGMWTSEELTTVGHLVTNYHVPGECQQFEAEQLDT